jgi:hypothetical protein
VLGAAEFFSAGLADGSLKDCCRLGLLYRCSPTQFFPYPARVIDEILRVTNELLEEMSPDA